MTGRRLSLYAVLFYGILFFYFLWPLLFLKATFLHGDYFNQFYPWTYHYAHALRAGFIPYWTDQMGCGFPLAAEGQVGPFYGIHLASYSFLPFYAAYTWNVPLHFLIGAAGFYATLRKTGLSRDAAGFGATLFSFSSLFGGCFYTTGTLRVLSWMPWCLWGIEHLADSDERSKRVWMAILAVFFSQMWTAGFPQMAVYAFGYFLLYVLLKRNLRPHGKAFWGVWLLGVVLALPAILATVELAQVSSRQGQGEDFALWGSVSPASLAGLFFPHWGNFLKSSYYLGVLPLFLSSPALFFKKSRPEKIFGILALVSFLLALGKYNPLYFYFVKVSGLTAFRNPLKFTFFFIFSLAVLSAHGFDRVLEMDRNSVPFKRWTQALFWTVVALVASPFILSFLYWLSGDALNHAAHRWIEGWFLHKSHPARSLSAYQAMGEEWLLGLKRLLDFRNPWNIYFSVLAAASFFVIRFSAGRKRLFKGFCLAVVVLDLAVFGRFLGIGFIGNVRSGHPEAHPDALVNRLVEFQKEKDGYFVEWTGEGRARNEILEPSSQMLFGLRHAGAYSPLLIKRYDELAHDLGFLDASLGRAELSLATWKSERAILNLIGVRWIVSTERLGLEDLWLVWEGRGRFIYENLDARPLVYGVYRVKNIPEKSARLAYLKSPAFQPDREVVLEEKMETPPLQPTFSGRADVQMLRNTPESVEVLIDAQSESFVIFRNAAYPGWKVTVDGQGQKLFPADHAFCGVFAGKGRHRVHFFYDHRHLDMALWVAAGAWIFLVVYLWKSKQK
ncbi:MAG: hypothetical protein HYZ52_04830 [Candidatus Omnitrophica bacterium]|nr:hypothetical protein [Candidatus Omnitrophota bacterium]